MGKYWGKDLSRTVLPATNSGPRPGDFPVGSVESRAAARAIAENKDEGLDELATILHKARARARAKNVERSETK
jgi:hypothetical protein